MTVIRSSRVSDRSFIFGFILAVIVVFFWFVSRGGWTVSQVVTLTLRIDAIIAWKWWVVMLPAFVVDAAVLVIDVLSIPALVMRYKSNEDLSPEEQVLLFPSIMSCINSILFIAAQVTLVLRLDHIWNTTFTVALLPYYIYSLKNIYMPIYMIRQGVTTIGEGIEDILSLMVPITVFLCCLKFDGKIAWSWGATFIAYWIYFGVLAVRDLFVIFTVGRVLVCFCVVSES